MNLFCTLSLRYVYRLGLFLCVLVAVSACRKGPQEQVVVYSNDFESDDLENISDGKINSYNDTRILGPYNKGGFNLTLNNLATHDLLEVSFDLYIHDSWDGNIQGVDGPDIWNLEIGKESFIRTTFSNNDCINCVPQSYPFNYLNSNQHPASGAYMTKLPGVCTQQGTTMYKIVKKISHTGRTFSMRCFDELIQTNMPDQLCDESWSVDNLLIKSVKLD